MPSDTTKMMPLGAEYRVRRYPAYGIEAPDASHDGVGRSQRRVGGRVGVALGLEHDGPVELGDPDDPVREDGPVGAAPKRHDVADGEVRWRDLIEDHRRPHRDGLAHRRARDDERRVTGQREDASEQQDPQRHRDECEKQPVEESPEAGDRAGRRSSSWLGG